MRRREWLTAFSLLMCVALIAARAQEPTPPPGPQPQQSESVTTLNLQARVVSVSAVVRDKRGAPVRDLTRDAFLLKDDGQLQAIRYFSQGSDLPLTLALLVDTSESQRLYIADETRASEIFFRAMLKKREDRATLVRFNRDVTTILPMTNSVPWLEQGLSRLTDPPPSGIPGWRNSTRLYDAVCDVSAQFLGKERGRRAMVLLTDGGDNASHHTLKDAIAAAQQADIVVYSIYYGFSAMTAGPSFSASTITQLAAGAKEGQANLSSISDATGGRLFVVNPGTSLDRIYAQIAEDLRLQYQLGYRAPDSRPGTYHRIELKAVDKHLIVEARKGYYSPQ